MARRPSSTCSSRVRSARRSKPTNSTPVWSPPMTRRLLLAFLMFLLPGTALAHEGNGPHGGPAVDAGPYFVELVTKDGQIRVFVYNEADAKPADMKTVKGTATVLLGQ